jgi:hypothetical protein
MRQLLVLVRPRDRQLSLEIVGRNRRDRLGGDSVLVHKLLRFRCSSQASFLLGIRGFLASFGRMFAQFF